MANRLIGSWLGVITAAATMMMAAAGTSFSWTYDFGPDSYTKELEVSSGSNLRIVEPFVDDTGNQYEITAPDTFVITTQAGHAYQLKVLSSSAPYTLTAGTDRVRSHSPARQTTATASRSGSGSAPGRTRR